MVELNNYAVVNNGDQLNSGYFNNTFSLVNYKHILNSLMLLEDGSTSSLLDSTFIGDFLFNNTDTSYVNTTESTCYYDELGVVAFCSVLDLFDDATLDNTIWTTGSANTSGYTVTSTEQDGYYFLQLSSGAENKITAENYLISNGTTGFDLNGQDTEVVLSFNYYLEGRYNNDLSSYSIILTDGTNEVVIDSLLATTSILSGNVILHIVYDNTTNTASVFKNGLLLSSGIDLSSLVSNKYLKIKITARDSGATGGTTASIKLYGVGYLKPGAQTEKVFQSQPVSHNTLFHSLFGHGVFLPQDFDHNMFVSTDGGSSFSNNLTDGYVDVPHNYSLIVKISKTPPSSISTNYINIPLLKAWGLLTR